MAEAAEDVEEEGIGREGYAFGGGGNIESSRDDSLYAVLNIDKAASPDSIRSAYRQLCVQYHPDKHATLDDQGKQAAQAIFQRIKYAYEVLSDAQKRAIYDVYGEEGLQANWDVMPRFQTPAELLEMHERLQRMKEEERLQQMTRPRGQAVLSVDGRWLMSILSESGGDAEDREEDLPSTDGLETSSHFLKQFRIAQTIDVPLTVNDTLEYSCHMSTTADGRGEGSVMASLRHSFSSGSWLTGTCQFGSVTGLSVKGFHQLPSACFIFSHLTAQVVNGMVIVPAPSILVGRQMGVRTVAELEWGSGLASDGEEGLTTRIVHSADRGPVNVAFTLGPYKSFASFQFKPRVSNRLSGLFMVKAGTHGLTLAYGIDHAVTKFTRVGLRVETSLPGGIVLSLRFRRASQALQIPIEVSNDFSLSALLYSNLLPLACFFLVRTLIVRPYARRQAAGAARRLHAQQAAELGQRRREAEAFIRLMQESYDISVTAERARGGLIIVNAWYGCLVTAQADENFPAGSVVDVTVAVQCLVKDSRLIIHDANKSALPGFYDPAPGSEKSLRVRYEFRHKVHEVTVSDSQPLRLPKQSHLVPNM